MNSQSKVIEKSKLQKAYSSAQSLRQKLHRSNERAEATSDVNKELNTKIKSLECRFLLKFDELHEKLEALNM